MFLLSMCESGSHSPGVALARRRADKHDCEQGMRLITFCTPAGWRETVISIVEVGIVCEESVHVGADTCELQIHRCSQGWESQVIQVKYCSTLRGNIPRPTLT